MRLSLAVPAATCMYISVIYKFPMGVSMAEVRIRSRIKKYNSTV